MRKPQYKSIYDRYKQSSKDLLNRAGVTDNKDLSKTNSDTPSRKTAFFVPKICLASQARYNNSTAQILFTGLIRHIYKRALCANTSQRNVASYDWKTSQNSPFWVICGADTVSSESDSNHLIFNSVINTQNLTGGHTHA